jgi:hypothetical protein
VRQKDPATQRMLGAIKQNIDIMNGVVGGTSANQDGWKQRSVTLEMLIELGVITEQQARSVAQR